MAVETNARTTKHGCRGKGGKDLACATAFLATNNNRGTVMPQGTYAYVATDTGYKACTSPQGKAGCNL